MSIPQMRLSERGGIGGGHPPPGLIEGDRDWLDAILQHAMMPD
jgi:hypothetical protein